MNAPTQLHPHDNFAKYIRWSVVTHAVIFSLIIFRAVFYPSEPIFIQHAIRVDMIALPTKSQFIPIAPKPAAPEFVEPKALPVPKKVLPIIKKVDPKKIDLRKSTTCSRMSFEIKSLASVNPPVSMTSNL